MFSLGSLCWSCAEVAGRWRCCQLSWVFLVLLLRNKEDVPHGNQPHTFFFSTLLKKNPSHLCLMSFLNTLLVVILLSLPKCRTIKKKINISPPGTWINPCCKSQAVCTFWGLCLFPLASLCELIVGLPIHMMNLIYSSVDNCVTESRANYRGGPLIAAHAETTWLHPLAMSHSSCLKMLSL